MRTIGTVLVMSITLAGCQTSGGTAQPPESGQKRDYLYDSGSRRANQLNTPGMEDDVPEEDRVEYLSDSGVRKSAEANGQSLTVDTGPSWVPLMDGISLAYDANYRNHPTPMKLNNDALLTQDEWESYLRPFALTLAPASRQPFLDGITRHSHRYDPVEQRLVFTPEDRRFGPYTRKSHIGLTGFIEDGSTHTVFLKLYYFGDGWIFADSAVIRADDTLIRLNGLNFSRDNAAGDVWETAYLNLDRPEYREAVEAIITSDRAIVRLSGNKYSDISVTDRFRADMAAMLTGMDAIQPAE